MPREDRNSPRWIPVRGEAALVERYTALAFSIARDYFIPGGSDDDLRQEALMGLLIGIRCYQSGRGMTFASYLGLAVRRHLQGRVRTANKQAARHLNESVRDVAIGEDLDLFDSIPAPGADPADVFERQERFRRVLAALPSLTPLERQSLADRLNGRQYRSGATRDKRFENATVRARNKLRDAA